MGLAGQTNPDHTFVSRAIRIKSAFWTWLISVARVVVGLPLVNGAARTLEL